MPRQVGPFFFIGKFGDKIGYKIGDDFFFRSVPDEVNQSEETKKASGDFGSASSCGKLIRHALHQTMDLEQPSKLTNRLNKIMANVLRKDTIHGTGAKIVLPEHLKLLKEFSFNKETKVDHVLRGVEAVIEQRELISVSIPSIGKIKRAPNTTHIEIKVIAITPNFVRGTFKQAVSEAVVIDARKPSKALELTLPRPGKDASLVILQVRALQIVNREIAVMEDKNYEAADIIAVLPPMPVVSVKPNHQPKLKKIPVPAPTKHYFGKASIPQRE